MAISGGDGSIILTTKVDESGLKSGLSKLKSGVGAFGKAFAVAGAAAVAAFAGITKAAVDSYAEFEQLKGGVETLFKDSANTLMKYADEAYKTSGMSANKYMEGVTSFSASMIASVGGDTAKAAELSNQAMIAISDNANKMGTDMEMIVQTYQSLARGNVGMLDNLKLGYGGTKAELERLIEDAEAYKKSMGEIVDYDASNFADVTQAIQAIQEKLGIAGATALEASSTIQGSASAMKASWQNLLTGMADPTQNFEQLLQNFISSVGTFAGNLLPVVQTAAQGVLQMIQGLLPQLATMVSQMLPMVVESVSGLLSTLYSLYPQIAQSILSILPQLIQAVSQLIVQVANQLPQLMQIIVSALPTVIQSIVSALPTVIQPIMSALPTVIQSILSVLPTIIPPLINGIVQVIVILAAALPQIIQPIIDNLPMIITAITGALIGNLPILIQGAMQLVVALVAALPQIIMALLEAMGGIAVQIGNALFKALPGPVQNAFKAAFDAIKAIWDKVQPYFAIIWKGIKAVFSVVGAVLGGFFSTAWAMIKAVWDTVTGYYSALWDTIAGIFSVVASVLSGNWSDAWDAIKGIVDTWTGYFQKIWDSIKNVFSAVASWFTNVFSTAWQGIQNVWGAVVNFFSGIWNGIVGIFSGVGSWFSSNFTSAVNGIKNAFSSIVSFFSGILSQIKGVFSDVGSWFASVGGNIVNGIISGVTGAASSLFSSLRNLATNALNAAKEALGIHSPSRLFRDEVGKMIPKGMAIGIDKAKNLVTKATQALVTDTRSEVQKVLDDMNEEMLDSEKLYAEESIRLKDSTVEADKEYLDNLKKTAETERKLYDARQKDIENLKKNIVDAYSEMANEALSSIEDLEKEQQNLEQKLAEYGGLMVEKTKKIWGKEVKYNVLADLDEQKEILQNYYDMLQTVKERANVPQEFFNVLREMGIDEGLEYANALLELSDEDFAEYIKDWEEKQKLSKDISKALYEEEAQQLADEIGNKFDEVEKEFFGVGENSADEFEDGFIRQLQFAIKNIKRTISGAFSGITPDANYGIGGYSINVPALARGSVLPGGKPFLAIVNDQPRGQTNVEAPLQTIVDAMNIALNNRGGSEIIREEHYNLNETELMTILHKLVKGGERLQGKSLISGGAY